MLGSLALQVIVAIVIFAAGSGTGWAVNQWRNGAKIAQLESHDSVATAANAQCKTDVQSVQKGVESIASFYEGKVKAAQAEVVKAQPKADKHTRAAITIKAAPIRTDESLCQAVEREQKEYVQARHTDN